jgi:hypothetical protein
MYLKDIDVNNDENKQNPWPQSASELYRLNYRRLSAKLVETFADSGCSVVRATDPHGRILGFLHRSRYYFFQVAAHWTHETEWTPFQIYEFSENLVTPGIEPANAVSLARNSGH